jgi:hypothetical protein
LILFLPSCGVLDYVSRPRIQAFPLRLCGHSCACVNLRGQSQAELSRVRAIGLLPKLLASGQVVINGFPEGPPQFGNGIPVKADNVTDAGDMTDKAAVFFAIFNAGGEPLVHHRVHGLAPK